MKNNELYKCEKCGSNNFNLQYEKIEDNENEDLNGEWMKVVCVYCRRASFAYPTDQKFLKHIEKAYIEEELGV